MDAPANTQRHEKCSCDGVTCVSRTTSRPVRGDRGEITEREQKDQKKIFQKHIKLVQNSIKAYNLKSATAKPTHESIEKLNKLMEEVEISIGNLHKEQLSCFQNGLQEQRILTEKNPPKLSLKKSNLSDMNLPAEVKALDAFLQKTGGPHGGWDQSEHQVFLRLLIKHGGQLSYSKEVQLHLPGKTLEEVEHHKDWHQELLSLKEKNKEAIQRWKANKLQTAEDARKRELKAKELEEQRRVKRNMKAKQRIMQWMEELRIAEWLKAINGTLDDV